MSTAIEWADLAHNVVHGCSPASEGCRHCYAARMDGTRQKHRVFTDVNGEVHTLGSLVKLLPGKPRRGARGQELKAREPGRYVYNGQVYLDPAALQAALDLPRTHQGKRGYRVFWNFRSDTFHESLTNEEIAAQFGVMAARPDLQFLVLTKRARRMREWFEWMDERPDPVERMNDALAVHANTGLDQFVDYHWPLPNVRLGVSGENQEMVDERVPDLVRTPAAGHFVSYEPALGPVDFWAIGDGSWYDSEGATRYNALTGTAWWGGTGDHGLGGGPRIDLIIVGAESGPNARPAELDWVRSVRDQVLSARDGRAVPEPGDPHLFIKQVDVCDRCSGDGWARNAYGDPLNGAIKGARHAEVRCSACAGTGLAGKVRKGNPAIDGRSWAEIPGS